MLPNCDCRFTEIFEVPPGTNRHFQHFQAHTISPRALQFPPTRYVMRVLDLVSQIRDVVLARRIFSSGKPQGVGISEWGRDGEGMGRVWKCPHQFTSNLGPRWTGSYHIKEGFQVSKGKWKRGKGESERGSKKQGDCAINMLSIYVHVHNNCL